ncbi:hypothetical protein OAY28_04045 [Gammaproteobacteria bacterium]|nr:hypothetical protein [Gammaproteobacteria bacterium]
MKSKTSIIALQRVQKKPAQIKSLYKLLNQRKYSISNSKKPSFSEHTRFVRAHPYRAWYLIEVNNTHIGSIYIQKDNSIGVNLPDENNALVPEILQKLLLRWKPLMPIPSVRPAGFYVNVPSANSTLQKEIQKMGGKHIQNTYTVSI